MIHPLRLVADPNYANSPPWLRISLASMAAEIPTLFSRTIPWEQKAALVKASK